MDKTTELLYSKFLQYRRVSTDSRTAKEGDVFFALKGEHFDGNRYAHKALQHGASIAVIDDPQFSTHAGCLLVDDSLDALQKLALHHRNQLKATVIGITGSNGKTTTKELFDRVLSQKFKTVATKGNLNNHIGVPLTLLSLPDDTGIAIIEMGANHGGEIATLCEIARPDLGLITNVGKAHLEGFGSFEGVIKAKSELYRYIRKSDGQIMINTDNDLLLQQAEEIAKIGYGTSTGYCRGKMIAGFPYVKMEVWTQQDNLLLESRLSGAYNFENILAAACAGFYFDVEPGSIKKAIENYIPDNNRSQIIQTDSNLVILDAYNANPTSMQAALENFRQSGYHNKVLILGEMLELGEASSEEHQKLLEMTKDQVFENVYLVGQYFMESSKKNENCFESVEQLVEKLEKHKLYGKTILVKGSRKNRLEQIISRL